MYSKTIPNSGERDAGCMFFRSDVSAFDVLGTQTAMDGSAGMTGRMKQSCETLTN